MIVQAAHPEWLLPALAVCAALAGIAGVSWIRTRRRLRDLVGAAYPLAALARELVLVGVVLAIGLALVGPHVGRRTVWLPASGVDLVLVVDVSRSMDARDIAPSRLVRARRLARDVLLALHPSDRAALAGFAGRGVLLTPLTSDVDALIEVLEALDSELILPQGSDLGGGVGAALTALDPGSERPATLVVLSDGEDPGPASHTGIEEAARQGVRVVTIGFGTEAGSAIPDHGVPLRDAAGEVVTTRRDAARLERLASASGGRAFLADAWGELPLGALVAEIRRDAGRFAGEPIARELPSPRVAPFAALALLLGLLEWIGTPGARRAAPGVAALALLAVAPPLARAEPPECLSPPCLVALGLQAAEEGRLQEAARALTVAAVTAQDAPLAALAYFDLGVVELQRERLEAARDAFLDAIALAPDDLQARFNLEWTLRALEAQPHPREADAGAPDSPQQGEAQGQDASGLEAGESEAEEARPADAAPSEAREGDPSAPVTLGPDEIERLLESVSDDPAAGLLRLTREPGDAGRDRTRSAW